MIFMLKTFSDSTEEYKAKVKHPYPLTPSPHLSVLQKYSLLNLCVCICKYIPCICLYTLNNIIHCSDNLFPLLNISWEVDIYIYLSISIYFSIFIIKISLILLIHCHIMLYI